MVKDSLVNPIQLPMGGAYYHLPSIPQALAANGRGLISFWRRSYRNSAEARKLSSTTAHFHSLAIFTPISIQLSRF